MSTASSNIPNSLYNFRSDVQSSAQTNGNSGLSFAQQLYASSIRTPSLPAPSINISDSPRSPSTIPSPSVTNSPAPAAVPPTTIIPPQTRDTPQPSVQSAVSTPLMPSPSRNLSDAGSPGDRSGSSASASRNTSIASRHPQSRPRGARKPSFSVRPTSSQRSGGVTPLPTPVATTTSPELASTTLHPHDPVPPHEAPHRTQSYQVVPPPPPSPVQEPPRRHQRAATFPYEMPESSSYPSQSLQGIPTHSSTQTRSNRQSVSYSSVKLQPSVRTVHTQAMPPPGSHQTSGSFTSSPTSHPSSPMYTSPITYTLPHGLNPTTTAYPFPPTSQSSVPASYPSPPASIPPTPMSPALSVPNYYPVAGTGPSNASSTGGTANMLKATGKAMGKAAKSPAGKAVGKVAGKVAVKLVSRALLGGVDGNDTITDTIGDAIGSGVEAAADALSDSDVVSSITEGVASLTTEDTSGVFFPSGDFLSQTQTILQQSNQGQPTDYQSINAQMQQIQGVINPTQPQPQQNVHNVQDLLHAVYKVEHQHHQQQQLATQNMLNSLQQQQHQATQNAYNTHLQQQQQLTAQNTFNSLQQQHQHQAAQNAYNTMLQQHQHQHQQLMLSQNTTPQYSPHPNMGSGNQASPLLLPNTAFGGVHPGFGQSATPGTGQQYPPQAGVSSPQPPITTMSTAPGLQQPSIGSQMTGLLSEALAVGKVAMKVANVMENLDDSSYTGTVDTSYTYDPSIQVYADNAAVEAISS